MRDSHRLKEKYELSLDNRQIASITVASLVVLGGVFMLGVVVGRKLSGDGMQQAPASDLLGQLDRRTDALDQVKAPEELTFHDELTKKTPTLIAEPPVVKPVAPVKPPEPVKVAEAPKAAPPEPALDELEEEDDEPVAVAPKEEPMPKAEPVVTRTVDAGGLKDALGKAARAPSEAADGQWTVQLSAYPDRGQADSFAAGLRDKGYAPYVVEADIPGKGLWYRVRMGRFPSKDAASRYMDDFQRETSLNAFVTTSN